MSINTHTFYCSDLDCETEVEMNGLMCENHTVDECPGCGIEAHLSGEGFCECCTWRLENDEAESKLTREPESWYRQNCECHHSPLCLECEVYYGCEDEGPYDGRTYDCNNCRREFKNKYWRNQNLCRDCEDLPPPPPVSPILSEEAVLEDEIEKIKEKLEHWSSGMTEGQIASWDALLLNRERRLRDMKCSGCRWNELNQQGHMGPGGCMWEGFDADDLRKLDLQLSRGGY
jgi:hypothetical protein